MRKLEFILKIIIGNLLLAFAVNMFIIPFSFISGGSTGLALIIQHYTNLQFSIITTCINVSMFILGYFILGKAFALTTLLSTCIYPLFIECTSSFSSIFTLTNDPLVACLAGGSLMGLGLGLVIQSGASTGGLDIPPLIIEKKFHINVAVTMYIMDTILLIIQMFFSSLEGILCGFILVFATSFVMNRVLTLGKTQYQVMIITAQYEEMRKAFLKDLNKGLTLFLIETGYQSKKQKALCSIVSQNDLHHIQVLIHSIDNHAFMIVSKVQEVRGLGFKSWDKKNFLGD